MAYKPSHFEGFKERIRWHKENLGHELELVASSELQSEIGSPVYFGGVVDHHGTGIHPAKLVYNLAKFVATQGAILCENAGVTKIEKLAQGYSLETPRGYLEAKEVILATNPTLEGEGTALHIKSVLTQQGVRVSRLARGLPSGSQIEYASKAILRDAIEGRTDF